MTKELFQQAVMQLLFIPYRWGGDDPINGFDCSGGVQEILAMVGLDPEGDQTAQGLYDYFKAKSVPSAPNVGTLFFFGKSTSQITHIGIDLGGCMFAFGGAGSVTTSREAAASMNAYGRIRPYNRRKDLVATVTPAGIPWNK